MVELHLAELEAGLNRLGFALKVPFTDASLEEGLIRLKKRIKELKKAGQWGSSRFDLFSVIGFERYEDMHSNILAWLLDPEESHGYGRRFLEWFLDETYGAVLPQGGDFSIHREVSLSKNAGRIDLLVKGERFRLAIENKVDSDEHTEQLGRYSKTIKDEGLYDDVYFVFLTPEGKLPQNEKDRVDWKPFSYRRIREFLDENQSKGESAFFIHCFCEHIRRNLEAGN